MGYVQLNDGLVVGIFAASQPDIQTIEAPDAVGLGWRWADSVWNAPAPTEPLLPLTARQLRLGLLKINIKPADVAAAIAALPADQRDQAEIEWDYASEYRRDHPLIATLGDSFGLSADQIDAAWRDAMAL